jgi:hypothetical protein
MTCRGYDAKAVKLSKTVKRRTALHYKDNHHRGSIIRSFVRILEDASRSRTSRNRGDRAE